MIIDDQEFTMKILNCVVSFPRVPTIDAFEFICVLLIVSSYFLFFTGLLFLGTSLLLGASGAIIAAYQNLTLAHSGLFLNCCLFLNCLWTEKSNLMDV